MRKLGTYLGMQVEIFAMATLFKVPVLCCKPESKILKYCWYKYNPLPIYSLMSLETLAGERQ